MTGTIVISWPAEWARVVCSNGQEWLGVAAVRLGDNKGGVFQPSCVRFVLGAVDFQGRDAEREATAPNVLAHLYAQVEWNGHVSYQVAMEISLLSLSEFSNPSSPDAVEKVVGSLIDRPNIQTMMIHPTFVLCCSPKGPKWMSIPYQYEL